MSKSKLLFGYLNTRLISPSIALSSGRKIHPEWRVQSQTHWTLVKSNEFCDRKLISLVHTIQALSREQTNRAVKIN